MFGGFWLGLAVGIAISILVGLVVHELRDRVHRLRKLPVVEDDLLNKSVIYLTEKGEKAHLFNDCMGLRFRNKSQPLGTKEVCKHCIKLRREERERHLRLRFEYKESTERAVSQRVPQPPARTDLCF